MLSNVLRVRIQSYLDLLQFLINIHLGWFGKPASKDNDRVRIFESTHVYRELASDLGVVAKYDTLVAQEIWALKNAVSKTSGCRDGMRS